MSGGATGFEIYPAIDLRGGRVVRLRRGDDAERTVYGDDPVAVLEGFAAAGARWVHAVDLDAAFGEAPQAELVARLARAARGQGILLQVGGGLRDRAAVERVLAAGCERAVVGSLLARNRGAFAGLAAAFPGRLVPALDVSVDGGAAGRAEVRIEGWRRGAEVGLTELAEVVATARCPAVLVTDVGRDGMMEGPNLALAARVAELARTPALLSGGVRSLDDLAAARSTAGIGGAVVGRALYEGAIDLAEAVALAAGANQVCCEGARRATGGRQAADSGEGTPRNSLPRGGGLEQPPFTGDATGLAARVIPCLDVAAGRVVKGVKFEHLRDVGDPAAAALAYAEQGADEIVFLDITAAPERRATDLDWVRRTAERVFVPLTVGGGVRSVDDARALLAAGADKVAVNTAAVDRPELIGELARRFGRQCVVLSVDARRRARPGVEAGASGAGASRAAAGDREEPRVLPEAGASAGSGAGTVSAWEVVVAGGRRPTGLDALAWLAEGVRLGAGELLLTSIDGDGTGEGYDLELLAAAARAVSVPLIASGGAGRPEHLAAALDAGAAAVLAASIFHDGHWTVGEVKARLAAAGHRVREVAV